MGTAAARFISRTIAQLQRHALVEEEVHVINLAPAAACIAPLPVGEQGAVAHAWAYEG
jgi:hypothetical protein